MPHPHLQGGGSSIGSATFRHNRGADGQRWNTDIERYSCVPPILSGDFLCKVFTGGSMKNKLGKLNGLEGLDQVINRFHLT